MTQAAKTLRDLLTDTEQSISAFAREHGFSRITLQTWVLGTRKPYNHNLPKLARALGVDLETLRAALEETAARRDG